MTTTEITPDPARIARLVAYRARRNAHRSCGIRTNGPVPADCKRCAMVDAYRDRREQYLDEVELCGRGDDLPTPVTFKSWLRSYSVHVAPVVEIRPVVEVEDDGIDWSVWAA